MKCCHGLLVGLVGMFVLAPHVWAGRTDILGPAGSGEFGSSVTVLPSGNIVVTDPGFDAPGPVSNVGAVYLYSRDGVLISTLKGSTANDQVGNGGVTVLTNGNYVVRSLNWNNGLATAAGAVTWGSGTSGVSGTVSTANSLVGSKASDQLGFGGVTVLSNGNYVVGSSLWDNGAVVNAGAMTWGSGTSGVSGIVGAANSLVGSTANDRVGGGVTVLSNGNYVVRNSNWDNGAIVDVGAVTWGSGASGVSGAVSVANSLVGSTVGDFVGDGGVTVLSNGNYVVRSSFWDNGAVVDAGAVTWGNGSSGVSGTVSAANSLVGSKTSDEVGDQGVTVLSNGNYVVRSSNWDNGVFFSAGAVTWGSGSSGVSGVVSVANSLVGSKASDEVGNQGVTALSNGNYVVRSTFWDNGAATNVGAVTWGSGVSGVSGTVSAANSLVGSNAEDRVGNHSVTALSNGNYVVSSLSWDNGAATDAGAVTWVSGTSAVSGTVSAANSLVGSTVNDQVGYGVIIALSNGNYVVNSTLWDNGAATDAGAVTWGSGTVSAANSLVGSTVNDYVGYEGVIALNNGSYVVRSIFWDNGTVTDAGAVTWGSGTSGVSGTVSAANSLVGGTANGQVGSGGVIPLLNGNYVVRSQFWDNGAVAHVGAVTWGSGTGGVSGEVSGANSLVGSTANDQVGSVSVTVLSNGNYAVISTAWDNGALTNAGAVTLGKGATGLTVGPVNAGNSVMGTVAGGGAFLSMAHESSREELVVGLRSENKVTLFSYNDPEISVEQSGGGVLADGAAVDMGGALPGTPVVRTYTVKNIGAFGLSGLVATVDGTHAPQFVVGGPGAAIVAPGGQTTFTVTFTAVGAGARSAALHLANNDLDEAPFDLALGGTGHTLSEAWRQQHFGSAANSGPGADLALPQHDGVTNLMKYATGMNPTVPGTMPGTLSHAGAVLTFNYQRADVALAEGITYTVEWSDVLPGTGTDWSTAGVSELVVEQGAVDLVNVTLPTGSGGRRFVRLSVERP